MGLVRLGKSGVTAGLALSFAACFFADNAEGAMLLAEIDVNFDVCHTTINGGCAGERGNRVGDPVNVHFSLVSNEELGGSWVIGPLTSADIGRVFIADSANAQDYLVLSFADLVASMTNGPAGAPSGGGEGDVWQFSTGLFQGSGTSGTDMPERIMWTGGDPPNVLAQRFGTPYSALDFYGYQIDRIEFTLDNLDLAYDEVAGMTYLADSFTFRIYGESVPAPVPLPAAAWLLLSGLGGLGFMGRRRKTH